MTKSRMWTKEEVLKLEDMLEENISYKNIALSLNRTVPSIAKKISTVIRKEKKVKVDIVWAKNNFDKKGHCNKDYIYYAKRDNGNIDYIDLNNLPKKGSRIDWLSIEDNDITLFHGNNFFNIKAIKGDINKRIILKYNEKEEVFFIDSIKKVGCYSVTKEKIIDLKYLHPYIKDLNTCYNLTPQSNKPTICNCPHCGIEKTMRIQTLYIQGFSCPICSKGSMGEKQTQATLEASNLKIFEDYFPQKTFDGLVSKKGNLLRYDFYIPEHNILIEVQGAQHYEEVELWGDLKETNYTDDLKRKYAKNNNYTLIEIDSRKGKLENIHSQLLQYCPFLNKNIKDARKELHNTKNNRWDYKDIVTSYDRGHGESMTSIGRRYNATQTTIRRILKDMGVYKQKQSSTQSTSKKVKCITTGEVFLSINKACKEYNVARGNMWKVLNEKISYCGKHPITGEKLQWEYVD